MATYDYWNYWFAEEQRFPWRDAIMSLVERIEDRLPITVSFLAIENHEIEMGGGGKAPRFKSTPSIAPVVQHIARVSVSSDLPTTGLNRNVSTNSSHRAIKGSQLQIQVLVNEHQELLAERLRGKVPDKATITWVSPLQAERYEEYKDADFLHALGMGRLLNKLGKFWPRSGPRWDALATVSLPDKQTGLILVEAKSHPREAYGSGCKASSGASRDLIEKSLHETKNWLGADPSADWTGPLYQYANRLAHLYFFREITGVQAWLVNIYFANDPYKPTSRDEWQRVIPQYKSELGLQGSLPYCIDLVIAAPGGE